MTNFDELIDKYFAILNETDGERRRELIKQVWTEDGKFVSPFAKVEGHAEIDAQVQRGQEQLPPGTEVRRTGDIDVLQDNYVRFSFEAAQPGSEAFIGGVDFGIIVDEKLQVVAGFFDFAPNPANQ